jgi:ABC-type Fe3+/spermidine/putrescine transport system ATPase subunit
MALLELNGVGKCLDDEWVVDGVDLALGDGEIVALLGPSGCGKTSLLRLIAGLTRPDRGEIRFEGRDLAPTPPHQRGFRMMFQEFALFPHRSVAGNVAFGLEMEKRSPDDIAKRVAEMLALVGLEGYDGRDVEALSGGERQRVALARSLAADPRLLMLDEPLGALDRALRQRLLLDLAQILRRIRVTTLFVTHDQSEALGVADRVAVMEAGQILQIDSPEALYQSPRSATVARFLGLSNILAARGCGPDAVTTALGRLPITTDHPLSNGPLTLLIRPEAAQLFSAGEDKQGSTQALVIEGRVTASLFQGNTYQVAIRVAAETAVNDAVALSFTLPAHPKPPAAGEPIRLRLDPRAMVALA